MQLTRLLSSTRLSPLTRPVHRWPSRVLLIAVTSIALVPALVTAQSSPVDFVRELDAERIVLHQVTGTGGSSGAVMSATVENRTDHPIRVNLTFSRPLYFANRGRGQNMIALQIVGGDGRYRVQGNSHFITIPSRQTYPVQLVAFCADFHRDNPAVSDRFTLVALPDRFRSVVNRIHAYQRQQPNAEIVRAAQVAIWLSDGISAEEIRERFEFSGRDESLARTFLEQG